jgi:hypothetical protein
MGWFVGGAACDRVMNVCGSNASRLPMLSTQCFVTRVTRVTRAIKII